MLSPATMRDLEQSNIIPSYLMLSPATMRDLQQSTLSPAILCYPQLCTMRDLQQSNVIPSYLMLSPATMRDLQQSNVIPSCLILSPATMRDLQQSNAIPSCLILSPATMRDLQQSNVIPTAVQRYPQLFWFVPCCFAISGQLSHVTHNYLVLSPSYFPIFPSSYLILSQTVLWYPATNVHHLQAAITCYSQLSRDIALTLTYIHAVFIRYLRLPWEFRTQPSYFTIFSWNQCWLAQGWGVHPSFCHKCPPVRLLRPFPW